MAWKKIKRITFEDKETPLVTISHTHFYFNSAACKLYSFNEYTRAIYHIDEENRKIGFEFINKDLEDSFSVFSRTGRLSGFRSSSVDLVNRFSWIKSVVNMKQPIDRRFRLRSEKKLRVIKLCPAFENSGNRKKRNDIPTEHTGIYRYKDSNEIVYIGKGNIKKRLQEKHRESWKFDQVEYSVILGEEDQYKWESFWIEKFKMKNGEKLPFYNQVSGRKLPTT
jgi:hypothetical protein